MTSLKSKIKIPNKTIIGQLLPKLENYQLNRFKFQKYDRFYYTTKNRFTIEDLNFNVKTYHYDEKNKDGGVHEWISNIIIKKTNGKHYIEDLMIIEDYYRNDQRHIDYKLQIDYENIVNYYNSHSVFDNNYVTQDFNGKIGDELRGYIDGIERI